MSESNNLNRIVQVSLSELDNLKINTKPKNTLKQNKQVKHLWNICGIFAFVVQIRTIFENRTNLMSDE